MADRVGLGSAHAAPIPTLAGSRCYDQEPLVKKVPVGKGEVAYWLRIKFQYSAEGKECAGTYAEMLPTLPEAEHQFENYRSLPFYVRCSPRNPSASTSTPTAMCVDRRIDLHCAQSGPVS
jgi:hypothetical protein